MATLSSCGVLNSKCNAATIASSCLTKTASTRLPHCLGFIRASNPQRSVGGKQEADAKLTLSRRSVMFTSLSAVGIMLLPKSSPAVEVMNDKADFREKLLEEIENLQHLVGKSLGNAKEAVTTKAEEAMSSLKFGNNKVAENLTEIKNSIDEPIQEDKLVQN